MQGSDTTRHVSVVRGLIFRAFISRSADADTSAVVLIHGIGVSHRYFSRLHRQLARTHTVVSLDLPGFGGLPKPTGNPDVETVAAALGEVLASLDLERAVLVGHSMGAQWAVETAIRRPDLVSRVVIIGPVADVEHRTVLAQTRALGLDALREPPAVNAVVFSDYVRCGISWYLAQLRHMLAYPIEERITRLTAPLLIIRGASDPIAGLRWCRLLRQQASNAALVLVPGHHHVVQQSAPRAVASAILAHSAGHAGTASEQ